MTDLGLTHIALTCSNANATIEFYQKFASLNVVHQREDNGVTVFWLGDGRRPFVIVFMETENPETPLGPFGHIGVAVETKQRVDELCQEAKKVGVKVNGPEDFGPPVGYWAFLKDPDGHTLELSFGQDVAEAVEQTVDVVH